MPEPDGPSEVRASTRTVLVLVVAACLTGLTMLFAWGTHRSAAPVDLGLPAWMLAPAFFAAEVWAVHLHVRGRQAQSFTLSEVPLLVGLFACAPLPLLAARLVGWGGALSPGRRRSPGRRIHTLASFVA